MPVPACIGFVNTLTWRGREQPGERLHSYEQLVDWAAAEGLVGPGEAARLRAWAQAKPASAQAALTRALELREALYRVLNALADGKSLPAADLGLISDRFATAVGRSRLEPAPTGLRWRWREGAVANAERISCEVARSAEALLTAGPVERVKCCAAAECGWVFLDVSRNHSRRWCDMGDCGNRAKVRRFRARRGTEEGRA